MKLSYIVPVYGVEKYLQQCVDSLLMQSMAETEIILIDDGSPDKCPELCDNYQKMHPEIIKVVHKTNGGLADARNAGLEIAQGDYIFFVDSDDYLVADNIGMIYDKAVKYDADILQTSYMKLDETSGKIKKIDSPFEYEKLLDHEKMEDEICFASSKVMVIFVWRNLYKRSFLEKNNIRFDATLRMIEDGPFDMCAFTQAERFVSVDIPVYCYRIRANSLQRQKYVKDYDLILQKQWGLKLGFYQQNCKQSQLYYADIAEYTIKAILPQLLANIYKNKVKERKAILKRIANLEMIRRSFKDYNIKGFRSKSLDWLMTWCIEKKLYLFAHILCQRVLFK